MAEHDLYRTGDPDAPAEIKDRNGEVVLNMCRKCRLAEIELSAPCDVPWVYNINHGDFPPNAVYCGRGSPWGNRFHIGSWWPEKKRSMTRDDVCDRFRDEDLPNLNVDYLRGKDLKCFCRPLRCHCDDILKKANR